MPVTQNVYTVPNNFDLQYNQGQKKIRADLVDQNFDDAAEVITQLLGDAANSVHKTGNETIAGDKTFTGHTRFNGDVDLNGTTNINGAVSLGNQIKVAILQSVFPVGSIYMTMNNTNPATLFGFGTWARIQGRMIIGASDNHPAGQTGGEEAHTLSWNEMPSHAHSRGTMEITGEINMITGGTSYAGAFYQTGPNNIINTKVGPGNVPNLGFQASRTWTGETSYSGNSWAHNNMPPYYSAYIWQRTA